MYSRNLTAYQFIKWHWFNVGQAIIGWRLLTLVVFKFFVKLLSVKFFGSVDASFQMVNFAISLVE